VIVLAASYVSLSSCVAGYILKQELFVQTVLKCFDPPIKHPGFATALETSSVPANYTRCTPVLLQHIRFTLSRLNERLSACIDVADTDKPSTP